MAKGATFYIGAANLVAQPLDPPLGLLSRNSGGSRTEGAKPDLVPVPGEAFAAPTLSIQLGLIEWRN